MKYEVIKGNLLQKLPDNEELIIAHVVNNKGYWGAGFSGQLSRKFPAAEKAYRLENKNYNLGDLQIVHVHEYIKIANMFGQDGIRGDTIDEDRRPIRYGALAKAMMALGYACDTLKIDQIYCPKFGAGLAGGDWDIIEQMILEIWCDNLIDVKVFEL